MHHVQLCVRLQALVWLEHQRECLWIHCGASHWNACPFLWLLRRRPKRTRLIRHTAHLLEHHISSPGSGLLLEMRNLFVAPLSGFPVYCRVGVWYVILFWTHLFRSHSFVSCRTQRSPPGFSFCGSQFLRTCFGHQERLLPGNARLRVTIPSASPRAPLAPWRPCPPLAMSCLFVQNRFCSHKISRRTGKIDTRLFWPV